jgi:hypothetical protein
LGAASILPDRLPGYFHGIDVNAHRFFNDAHFYRRKTACVVYLP